MLRFLLLSLLTLALTGCVTAKGPRVYGPPKEKISLMTFSYLQQGKRYFERGYYKRAMHDLYPLACDGIKEAQYAVGYMYYYGYGVAQDIDIGYFWIKRSADQGFQPAIGALELISCQGEKDFRYKKRFKALDP